MYSSRKVRNTARSRKSGSLSSTSSFSNDDEEDDDDDDDDDDPFFQVSTQTQGSLWRQYSLIAKDYKLRSTPKGICCANDKHRPWFLKIIFLVVVAFGLFNCALELHFSTYAPQKVTINGGDQILLPTSTYFNKAVNFTTKIINDTQNLQLYVLKDIPKVSPNITSYTNGGTFHMPSWTYQYWGLHLLKGSTVKISLCCDLHLQFYILRGEKKLKKWTQETLFTNYDFHTSIHPQKNCEKISTYKSHLLTVEKSDIYYLSFATSVGWRFLTKVNVILNFNRTYYDLSNTKYSCELSNNTCRTLLQYGSNDVSLIQAFSKYQGQHSAFQEIKMTYIPLPRWIFYLKFLGGIYAAVIAITILYTIWRLIVTKCFPTKSETKSLLQDQVNSSYLYSLQSPTSDRKWVVITPLHQRNKSSSNCLYEIQEQDTSSLVRSTEVEDGGVSDRRDSITSIESLFMRSRHETLMEDTLYRNQMLDNDQQLLDSCMTSAGVSAI